MRFIGNKQKLVNFLYNPIKGLESENYTFLDLFSGTTSVAQFIKQKGYRVISNDLLHFSFILQKAYIENNDYPIFETLCGTNTKDQYQLVIEKLNSITPESDFIHCNYTEDGSGMKSRNYFSKNNACKIDSIRNQIDIWKRDNEVTALEANILLASLIEAVPYVSNIAGTYGAALKIDDPRKFKPIKMNKIKLINNFRNNQAFNVDGMQLLKHIEADILYVDPPYNARQYPANYHILEQVAIWDKHIRDDTSTGLRNYDTQKSKFCSKKEVNDEFAKLIELAVKEAKISHLLFSYSTDGLMSHEYMEDLMSSYGKTEVYKHEYQRYKSNSNGESANEVAELLFHLSLV